MFKRANGNCSPFSAFPCDVIDEQGIQHTGLLIIRSNYPSGQFALVNNVGVDSSALKMSEDLRYFSLSRTVVSYHIDKDGITDPMLGFLPINT